jgi:hypothetical protein
VVDLVEKQAGGVPFDPRLAVAKFCGILARYRVKRVAGDAFAGKTFQYDFQREGIGYDVSGRSASDLYEEFEPKLNAGEVELLDDATLIEQLVCLVWRGTKITHEVNGHDDFANAVAGLVHVLAGLHVVSVGPVIVTRGAPDTFGASAEDDTRVPADCRPVLQVDQSS